jgi:hypothetical protein
MPFIEGNSYWTFRNKHGRNYKYTPEELWEVALEYFQWVESNPLKEEQLFAYQGKVTRESVNKMRAMTIEGFTLFADICHNTFDSYRKKDDFVKVINAIETTIKTQKFEGAAATLLNPNIIARDLGLKDNQDITSGGKEISGINYVKPSE